MSENDFSRPGNWIGCRLLPAAAAVAGGVTSMPALATAPACQPWAAGNVYTGGDTATEAGKAYKANWWTQGDDPATHNGGPGTGQPWTVVTTCGATPPPPPRRRRLRRRLRRRRRRPRRRRPPRRPRRRPRPPPPAAAVRDPRPGRLPARQLRQRLRLRADRRRAGRVERHRPGLRRLPGNGNIVFNRCSASECAGVESDADFLAGIKAQQAKGKKVVISIGGANGEVQLTSAAAATNFVNSVSAIIDSWGLDGVDVDFENQSLSLQAGDSDFRSPTTPVVVNLISALKQLKARYGAKFVLTMAPETFFVQLGYQFYGPGPNNAQDPRAGAFLPVIYALRDSLTLLTVQDYNSGPIMGLDNQYHQMGGADFHIAMTDMLLTGFPVAGNTSACSRR